MKLILIRTLKIGTALSLITLLTACTIISPVIRDRGQDYKKAKTAEELKLPKSVPTSAKSHRYDIPNVETKNPVVSHMPPGFGDVAW